MSKTKKTITVRRQKIKKNHVREKLIFFTILVLILLVIAAFARKLCPYDPDMQDLLLAQKPPSTRIIYWELTVTEGICFREYWWEARRVFMQHCFW